MVLEVEWLAREEEVMCVEGRVPAREAAEMMGQNVHCREARHGLVIELGLERKKKKGQ